MNRLSLMLADMDIGQMMNEESHFMDSRMYAILVTVGALTLAIGLAVIGALYFSLKNKKRKPHRRPHLEKPEAGASVPTKKIFERKPAETDMRKKSHRRRRSRRPLNPTLAQTRGLPPLRDENTPLPPMP